VFNWDQPFLVEWVGWIFCALLGKNRFWLVWLINPFQPTSNQVEMVKKHLLDYVA